MGKYNTLNSLFTAIANSIRNKTGNSEKIIADDFPEAIDSLSTDGITPSGTKNITENGTYDVTNFASAMVNVPSSATTLYTVPITLGTALGGGTNSNKVVLTGHDFVKTNYTNENFFAIWIPVSATSAAASGVTGMVYHGNKPMLTTKATYYGFFMRSAGETANASLMANTAKLNGSGYNVSLRANSSGNINLYVASAYTVPAGDYLLVLGLME